MDTLRENELTDTPYFYLTSRNCRTRFTIFMHLVMSSRLHVSPYARSRGRKLKHMFISIIEIPTISESMRYKSHTKTGTNPTKKSYPTVGMITHSLQRCIQVVFQSKPNKSQKQDRNRQHHFKYYIEPYECPCTQSRSKGKSR